MDSSPRNRKPSRSRRRLDLESLEVRNLLSSAGIASVTPADGALLTQSPQQIVVTFNRNDIPSWISGFDLQIEELNGNGSTTPLWNSSDTPPEYTNPGGNQLIIPLQYMNPFSGATQNITLQPGTYQVDLPAYSGVSYAASGAADGLTPLWNPFADYAIGTFTVLGQGATLAGATNLGTVGSSAETVSGSLTPSNYQQAVDLYKVNLARGHDWQLGLNVVASAIGSELQPALSLFDAQGNLIATRNAGTGTASDPTDPYLFAGLAPGTYYVGVSGAGNLPNIAGGYNPTTGTPGIVGLNQAAGPYGFQLELVATPHDQPAQVTSFQVNRLDALSPAPTSLTLTFSSAIGLSNVFVVDGQQHALELYDSHGQLWATTPESYNTQTATLQLMIDEPLPAGSYTLVAPTQGGLVDLTGAAVTAPGQPAGVLGTFNVAPGIANTAGDLGVLWPSQANKVWPTAADSFVEQTTLSNRSQSTYRFVVTIPGYYKLQTQVVGGLTSMVLFGNGQTNVLSTSSVGLANTSVNLTPGTYELRFANTGSTPVTVDWLFKYVSIDWEKIIDNGVGQYYSLSLGLVSSDASSGVSGSSAIVAAPANPGSFLGGFSSGPLTSSLFATQTSSLMGAPTVATESIGVVGPTVESGSIAIADAATGLLPGIRYQASEELADIDATLAGTANTRPSVDPSVVRAETSIASATESRGAQADARALASARWLESIGSMLEDWFAPQRPAARTWGDSPEESAPLALAQTYEEARPIERNDAFGETRTAGMDPIALTGLVAVAAATYRVRRVRSESKRLTLAGSTKGFRRSIPAPHSAVTRMPATWVRPRD